MNEVTKPAHTPGPWKQNGDAITQVNGSYPFCVAARGAYIPEHHTAFKMDDNWNANARLIAAAPEMRNELEALKHDLEAADLDGWSPWKQHLGEIRALLARIDGTPNAS